MFEWTKHRKGTSFYAFFLNLPQSLSHPRVCLWPLCVCMCFNGISVWLKWLSTGNIHFSSRHFQVIPNREDLIQNANRTCAQLLARRRRIIAAKTIAFRKWPLDGVGVYYYLFRTHLGHTCFLSLYVLFIPKLFNLLPFIIFCWPAIVQTSVPVPNRWCNPWRKLVVTYANTNCACKMTLLTSVQSFLHFWIAYEPASLIFAKKKKTRETSSANVLPILQAHNH